MLLFDIILLFVIKDDENPKLPDRRCVFGSFIVSGLLYLLGLINSQGFFRIGLIGSDGTVTTYIDMMAYYAFFFLLYWIAIGLIFYGIKSIYMIIAEEGKKSNKSAWE
jgi:uncharacterized membrane protein HdeD (DUF308 family)